MFGYPVETLSHVWYITYVTFKPPCNFLFIKLKAITDCLHKHPGKNVTNILTREEVENALLGSCMEFHLNFMDGVSSSKALLCLYDKASGHT